MKPVRDPAALTASRDAVLSHASALIERIAELVSENKEVIDMNANLTEGLADEDAALTAARDEVAALKAKLLEVERQYRTAFDAGHVYGFAFGVGTAGGPVAEAMLAGEPMCPSHAEADRVWAEWNGRIATTTAHIGCAARAAT